MFNKTIDEMDDQERCLLRAYGILRERALYWEIQYGDMARATAYDSAAAILKYTPKAACEVVAKLLKSAVANAENKDMDTSRLYVAECYVGQGPTLKRIRPRAQGRANRINKKTSHITLVLKEAE